MKPRSYKVWNPDGTSVVYKRQGKAALEELQQWVVGYIERVKRDGVYLFVNEDGLRLKLPRNTQWPEFVGPVVEIETGFSV